MLAYQSVQVPTRSKIRARGPEEGAGVRVVMFKWQSGILTICDLKTFNFRKCHYCW